MSTSRGLGKGLGALISIFDDEDEVGQAKPKATSSDKTLTSNVSTDNAIQELPVDLIDSNINQPRKDFNPEHLQELAESIQSNGIFQPILVTKAGQRFMIVAGERRWRATKIAGLKTIPAIVKNFNTRQISEIAIVENLQREDLNIVELALGIKKLMDEHFLTQEKVAIALGKNRSSIANTLRLLNLPPTVQQMVRTGAITSGHAKVLVSVTDNDKCIALAHQSAKEGLSVRQLEELLKTGRAPQFNFSSPMPRAQNLELRQLERECTQSLGAKVSIQGDGRRGKILIEYFDEKDLSRLVAKLK